MNCQDYREWIEEAALGAIAGTIDDTRRAELDAHLVACSECRRAFEAAQRLYAAIDQGVAARVQGKPSGDFAARVRIRLADEGERAQARWWRPSVWIPALGSTALALLLLSIWVARRPNEHRSPPPKQQTAQAVSASPEGLGARGRGPGAGGQGPVVARSRGPRPRSNRSHRRQSTPDSEAPKLQVQIQPGQWAAVESLYRAGQNGSLKGVTEASATADQPLQVKPVEVPPLVVAELQDPKPVGSEPESTNEDR